MAWLTIHMWLLLLGAFLLGLLLGWWIWHRERIVERVVERPAPAPAPIPAAAAQSSAPMQAVSPPPEPEAPKEVGIKPLLFSSPNNGPADDLKKIKGVGPQLEGLLNSLGVYYFKQIGDWTRDHVAWVDQRLQFPGRIDREDWIAQARILQTGEETEFAKRYDKGETPSSYKDGDKKGSIDGGSDNS